MWFTCVRKLAWELKYFTPFCKELPNYMSTKKSMTQLHLTFTYMKSWPIIFFFCFKNQMLFSLFWRGCRPLIGGWNNEHVMTECNDSANYLNHCQEHWSQILYYNAFLVFFFLAKRLAQCFLGCCTTRMFVSYMYKHDLAFLRCLHKLFSFLKQRC